MEYRPLGNSGAVVSALALGTMTFGAESDEKIARAILDRYAEAGGNFLDVADVYAGGVSEEIVGRWLSSNPDSSRGMVLASKGRFPTGPLPNDLGNSRIHLRRALDNSLRRLDVEHIDLYQLHAWDDITPLDETLRFLDDAITAGKIGYYGFSNYLGWHISKASETAKSHHWMPPVTVQVQYNLLVRDIEHEVLPAARDQGMGLLAWSPLAGGWLSGKYKRGIFPTGSTRLGDNPQRGMEAWEARSSQENTWAVLDAVKQVAEACGLSPAQVALAWLKQQPAVTSVILGARTVDQLDDNLAVAEQTLEGSHVEQLDAVSTPRLGDYPYGRLAAAQRDRKLEGGR